MTTLQDPVSPRRAEGDEPQHVVKRWELFEQDDDLVHRFLGRYLWTPVARRTVRLLVRKRLLEFAGHAAVSSWTDMTDTATATTQEFTAAVEGIDGVDRILYRTRGTHVEFVVTATRPWDEVIDDIEPRLRGLLLSKVHSFDYSVVQLDWNEPIPADYVEVPSLGESAPRP